MSASVGSRTYSGTPARLTCSLWGSCWAAHAAGTPLYRLIGARRDRVPIHGSSLVLGSAEAYALQAAELKSAGWAAYELHRPGTVEQDLAAYRACREAVGPNFRLMADPVAACSKIDDCTLARL